MKVEKTQIEQIQTMLYQDDASVQFYRQGSKPELGYWYLTNKGVAEAGKSNKEGDLEFYKTRSIDSLLKFISEGEVIAIVNLDGSNVGDEEFKDWDHLARYMGITDLVVLSTKVPKRIAEKFTYYVTKTDDTVSHKVRELIYNFVVESIKENAERDAFR